MSEVRARSLKLAHQARAVADPPMVGDLTVAYAHDVNYREGGLAAGRRDAEQLPAMCAEIGFVRRHEIAFRDLTVNGRAPVGKRLAERLVDRPRAIAVGWKSPNGV